MPHAAKDWMRAVEDPSEMLAAKNSLWVEAHQLRVERDELLAEIERLKSAEIKDRILMADGIELTQNLFDGLEDEYVRMRIEVRKHADAASELQKENERLKRELDAERQLRGEFESVAEAKDGRLEELDAYEQCYRIASNYITQHNLAITDFAEENVSYPVRDVIHSQRMQIERLKSELAAAPRWVPVSKHVFDQRFHICFTEDDCIVDARCPRSDGRWVLANAAAIRASVTHVLENLNPPIINPHPARVSGDDHRGDYEPTADCCGPATVPLEEGEKCPECDGGTAQFVQPRDCRCHISPPCDACVANRPRCDNCGTKEKVVADTDVAMNYEQMASAFDSVVDRLRAIHTPPKGWVDPRVQREIDDASTKPVVRDAIGQDVREGDVMSNSTY